ncbi:MAG: pirin family protein [Frankiaceae bacterium]
MSGPVSSIDVGGIGTRPGAATTSTLELSPSRLATVGGLQVRRALPRRARRTVGAWCFVDHFGPALVDPGAPVEIGPHPHAGLQTVTWLAEGEQVHHDSLGSEQPIRPGQLNLMTAGAGVAHAEESLDYRGAVHGVQLWVAQPEATRHGPPAFEHHRELPQTGLGAVVATVLVGRFAGLTSAARTDTPLVGVDLRAGAGVAVLPLEPAHEHALVVLAGALSIRGEAASGGSTGAPVVGPGTLAYLGVGREELVVTATEGTRALLLGGEPFGEQVLMWWNFVARTKDEIDAARADWQAGDGPRFGRVASAAPRVPAPPTPWRPAA